MKKTLLFSLLGTSIGLSAIAENNNDFIAGPKLEWFSPLYVNSNKGQTTINTLKTNSKGEVFQLASFGSHSSTSVTGNFLNHSFDGAPYENGTSYNNNLLLTKYNMKGEVSWNIFSNYGDVSISACALIPTSDGGAIAALKVRHTNSDEQSRNILFSVVSQNGNQTDIKWDYPGKWIYQGIIIKIDNKGNIVKAKKIDIDHSPQPTATNATYTVATTDGFYFYDATEDALGNIYIAGLQKKDITIDNIIIKCHNTDSWNGDSQNSAGNGFIIKIDNDLNYISHISTGGSSTYDSFKHIAYKNDALYVSGLTKGSEGEKITLGNKELLPGTNISMITAKLNIDLSVDWFSLIPGVISNSKNAIQTNSISFSPEGQKMFVAGRIQGGLSFDANNNDEYDITSPAAQYNGYVVEVNTTTGKCENGIINSAAGIGDMSGVICNNDSIYTYGYDWARKDKIILNSYDRNFITETSYGLMTGGGSATAWSVVASGDTILVAGRSQANQSLSFRGSDQSFTSPYTWSGVVASYVFQGVKFTSDPISTSLVEDILSDILISTNSNEVLISGVKGKTIEIFDLTGKLIVNKISISDSESFILNRKGIYIIRIEDYCKKIIL